MAANRPFKCAVVAAFLVSLAFTQIRSSYGLQATDGLVKAGLKGNGGIYGWLLSLSGLLVVFLELPLTSITRRYAPPLMVAGGYALVGLGLGVNAFGASVPLLVTSMFILTVGEIVALPVNNSYLAGLCPDDMRGRYQGIISMTWSCATLIGPTIGLEIYGFNPVVLWVSVAGIGLLAATAMLMTGEPAVEAEATAR